MQCTKVRYKWQSPFAICIGVVPRKLLERPGVSCLYILFEDSNRIMVYTCLTSRKKKNIQYVDVEYLFIYLQPQRDYHHLAGEAFLTSQVRPDLHHTGGDCFHLAGEAFLTQQVRFNLHHAGRDCFHLAGEAFLT